MSHESSLPAQAGSTLERRVNSSQHISRYRQHLVGTTQQDFEAQQQQSSHREKSTGERSEEQIVLEYVKKQSLLEGQHLKKTKGKARASAEDELDENLQQAMRSSLHGDLAKNGVALGTHSRSMRQGPPRDNQNTPSHMHLASMAQLSAGGSFRDVEI